MIHNYRTGKIIRIEEETPLVKNYILDLKVKARPGQYVMVWLPGVGEKPFGVALADPLMLSVAKVGPFTEKIHQLNEGDPLTFRGPYGHGFKLTGSRILMVAGGYGAVPLYFLAKNFPKAKRKNIFVVIGARTREMLPFAEKFRHLGCNVLTTTDDGSQGFPVFTTELSQVILSKRRIDSVYTCGPPVMMRKVAELCQRKKINCQVSMEKYFKCGGMGLCGECSCGGKLVCVDGPVFNGKFILNNI